MTETVYDVVSIGNALVDVLAKVGDTFLNERGLNKGNMTLVEAAEAGKIYADVIPERQVSGGSAANTVAGLASLG
ncbi:MAG: adenosine kinase, partial [Alphaproteobacteria bacterium]|nr:adenosine kinase [Alphaproteobacteria bacterium]